MNKIFAQLLKARHINDEFLHPKYENLCSPYELPDMKKATARIKNAIKNNEKILVYGDYDVDGVTASTLMYETLILAGAKRDDLSIMLPDRFIDGYGMSSRLTGRAKETNTKLVITVDCGSRNHEIVEELKSLGIDTIITDHHECEETLPHAIAVINPKRLDYKGPASLKDLAGVGVAFKLAEALKNEGQIKDGQEKWLLDLVLLGTICDNMLLTGENRILGYFGVKVLAKTRREGLKELMRTAGVKSITSESIGFQLGPRLNAAGRLDTAELALKLLCTTSKAEAASLASKLEELNKSRRKEQIEAVNEIAARHDNNKTKDPVIVEVGKWHEGIIGIVAGRLVENYHQPAIVLTEVENDIYKGSGRSFGDFNLAKALENVKDTIVSGGGHAAAAGVRVSKISLDDFRAKINAYYKSLHLKNQEKYLESTADLTITELKDFSLDLLEDMKLLEPYGAGNEEPIFRITSAMILDIKRMGDKGQHLRLDIKGKDGKILKCVAFSAPKNWFDLSPDENYDFLVKPVMNEWNGVRSIEARLLSVIF